ncbi:MAG: histidinol-phosphatase HisJ family protein [Peptococcaceae bacterium]|nr:histidinol-phosphatase HisJ family protein [Peptococcaceae bacterium]
MKKLPMDLHSHSAFSFDGSHSVRDMCAAAFQAGVEIYAVTDHCDVAGWEEYDLANTIRQSVAEIRGCGKDYAGKMKILAGLELGEPLDRPECTKEVLADNHFDLVLGSIHNVKDRPDFYYLNFQDESLDLNLELELYFQSLLAMIRWGGIDVAAHITYPFRYILERCPYPYDFDAWDHHLDEVIRLLAEKGLGLEINTSGVKKTPSYLMPEERWIRRYRELGGENLTLGADAHVPRDVGSGICRGLAAARAAGFKWLCYYEEHKPRHIKI